LLALAIPFAYIPV